jgi:chemotaxis protein histidine kinase CheA
MTTSEADEKDEAIFPFFEEEAEEDIQKIEHTLQAWHRGLHKTPHEDLCFSFHALKGAAFSIGLVRIGTLTGATKDILQKIPPKEIDGYLPSVTKTCVLVLEAVKALLHEAREPLYYAAKPEILVQAVEALLQLEAKTALQLRTA